MLKMREVSKLQWPSVDIELRDTRITDEVWWSGRHNSYVTVENPEGHWLRGGVRCELLCINGFGEVRWNATPSEVKYGRKRLAEGATITACDNVEYALAANYFELEEA